MTYNPANWYWSIASNPDHVWSSAANGLVATTDTAYEAWLAAGNVPTPAATIHAAMGVVIQQAGLLDDSDITMHRVGEAVALGLNSWTAADVVAWVNYRRALRAIIDGSDTTSTAVPAKPAYPAGT